ncbi:MAG: hypothetical protein HRT69_00860 [Flavobacteriaceae bacterium]|nr:hypothetical protein [Flavobacteriaceae bacterium]
MMKNLKKEVVILFVAVEEENVKQIKTTKSVNCKKENEVNELTEIWELVKS